MKCDGVTDDGPALQALVDRVSASTSPDIQLPYGTCLINTTVSIHRAPVHLRGHSWSEAISTGTTLSTTNTAISPFVISPLVPNGIVQTNGTSIEGVAIAQDQPLPVTAAASMTAGSRQIVTSVPAKVGSAVVGPGIRNETFVTASGGTPPPNPPPLPAAPPAPARAAPGAPGAPTVYPPFFVVRDTASISFRGIYGFGIYDGISFFNVGRDEVAGIYGQFFHNIITTDAGYDLAHYSDFHIWPFWNSIKGFQIDQNGTSYRAGPLLDVVMAWQEANMDAIVLGRQDGATLRDMFFFMANGGITFKNLPGHYGFATNIMIDQVQCDSTVHCLKNVGQPGATIYLGALNSFGQRGASTGTVYPGANAIYADANSCFNIAGGDIKMGFPDTNVVELDATTCISAVYLHSLQTYLMAGATGSSIFRLGYTAPGNAPHIVNVDSPLNIALSSGGYMAGVNWATTNAVVRIPGLDYQILEAPAGAGFNGHRYAIENARPKVIFEADDGRPISSIDIVMPTDPYDGMETVIMSTVPMAGLKLSDPNGRPIIAAPSSLPPYTALRFKWTNTGSQIVWFRQ